MDRLTSSLQTGNPWPLGATYDGKGINFAVFSANAQAMELCIFDTSGTFELTRLRLRGHTGDVWHGFLPGALPGLIYGLRAHGPWHPDRGHRFDASKLLLDPYARDIVGEFIWRNDQFGPDRRQTARRMDTHDNARLALKARVIHDDYDWRGDRPPAIPMTESVLYECHVKGFSKSNPAIPSTLRGTYAGLGHQASIHHLKNLGITAVSLLPVHYNISEERLISMGLSNYWGYNTIGFFCVNPRLASGAKGCAPQTEFRDMVRSLHAAGIEVILDVVYNHTAEAGDGGPTISFRGLDNASYYRLVNNDMRDYENYSGCGNTLDVSKPRVLQLVMDSLRYWVSEMHVDGFRFDLASVLGRTDTGFSAQSSFFAAVAQDPVLSRVKMIAEPWDIGPGGYQVGGFPRGWCEWNDKCRDGMRRFWVQSAASPYAPGDAGTRGDFAMRLCGSSDLFQARMRSSSESVNYVVSHDGFTLRDLVSYNHRNNFANGEDNRDGHSHNLNFNCGAEGLSVAPMTTRLRAKLQRALLASTVLSQGTPMLCAGDELGHTQDGNNNPYCQDSAISWLNWSTVDHDLLAFTQRLIGLRHLLRPFANFWYSGVADAEGIYDLSWWNADGSVLQSDAWHHPMNRSLSCMIGKPGRSATPLLFLINSGAQPVAFTLPKGPWQAMLDTCQPTGKADWRTTGMTPVPVSSHSLMLLQQIPGRTTYMTESPRGMATPSAWGPLGL